jgi:hypothetical protein
MRLILSNADARELEALMEAHPVDWEFVISDAERSEATIIYAGRRFKGKMRRTPSTPGSFVIEDFDGRRIAEGVAE